MLEFGQRLGELLVGPGLITPGQLDEALSIQVIHGARIGTNLVELGLLPINTLGSALGEQHGVPVADSKDFEDATQETLSIVPKEVCASYGLFPLRYERPSIIHLAMVDPHKLDLLDQVGAILGIATIHPYAAPELRLHHFLEVRYQVPRPKRFLRTPEEVIEKPRAIKYERRHYLAATLTPDAELPTLRSRTSGELLQMVFGPEQLKQDVGESGELPEIIISLEGFEEPKETCTIDEVVAAVEAAEDRDALIDALLLPLLSGVDLSVLFVIRGDMAVALGARGTDFNQDVVRTLVVPLSISTMFQEVLAERVPRCSDAKGDATQQMISAYLSNPAPTEVCLVPILIEDRVVNLLCLQTTTKLEKLAKADLSRLAEAAGKSYVKLMRQEITAITQAPTLEGAPTADLDEATPSGSLSLVSAYDEDKSTPIAVSPEPIEDAGSRVAQQLKVLPRDQRQFGRYTLIYRLASGGMANLYLAQLSGKGGFAKEVAIKRIHEHLSEEAEFIRMFIDEARLVARVAHPNVVQVVEFDCVDDSFYIAMEYVHGESLHALLNRARPKPALSARIVAQAAAGLHAAHEICDQKGERLNVVHRDVSPQNLLISYQGAVKVVDFGVARARGNLATTSVGTVKGKLAYMSPEQVRAQELDRRADIFSLGIVLWESTTFRRLFKSKTETETMVRVVKGEITPPTKIRPDYPPELEGIVMKALERDRSKRYQTAEELQAALEVFIVNSESLVLASALGKLMGKTFKDRIAEKRAVQEQFEQEASCTKS